MQLERTGKANGHAQESANTEQFYEVIDAATLAQRLNVPATWVMEQTRRRTLDPIPHLKLGRYVRFRWLAPDLKAWLERRCKGGK